MGSNLVDAQFTYPRVRTDTGLFEVIYGGATGAMQAFGDRVSQDEILKIMAHLETLKKR
jgi:cytochrome c-L